MAKKESLSSSKTSIPITNESDTAAKKPVKKQIKLEENIDFYIENGLYVFTEHYLKKRGYCCESGCRHCPYS